MHRIDSATARQNANGKGKTGFHDNADLPNQDATYFTPEWSNALQEEVANVIEGLGLTLDKTDNGQLLKALVQQFGEKKVLEDAIKEYREDIKEAVGRIETLEERTYEDTQVGELFWTTKHFATANEVATYKGYGTWQRALQGRVAVGFSDDPEDPVDFRTHGKLYGEREHQLTIEEMPAHTHDLRVNRDDGSGKYPEDASGTEEWSTGKTESAGGSQPHNNMQPSQTLDCWERVS
ncbi:phage tail protein [Psychrobacter celer]|uniref:phage tail protein n=1 Tax=Psychrobacter celer TaxID=306572 RepID=UPI002FE47847